MYIDNSIIVTGEYREMIINSFNEYNNSPKELDNVLRLINGLLVIQESFKESINDKSNKTIWFRFFKDDSLATDINNIKMDLKNLYSSNQYYCNNVINIAMNDLTNFQILFS